MRSPIKQRVPLPRTDEYGKFRFHAHNRLLRDEKTGGWLIRKDLVESMKAEGYREEEPITAYSNDDGSLTIIDGHNRLLAAQSLNLPVAYLSFKRDARPEWTPVKSSITRRAWRLSDAVRAYAQDGNLHYIELAEYSQRTGIQLALSAGILAGRSGTSNEVNAACRNGSYVVKNRGKADIVADIVLTARPHIPWATDQRFVAAVSALAYVDGFSPMHLMERIERFPEFLEKGRDRDAMLEMLDALYNKYQRVRFDLVAETRKVLKRRSNR